MTIPNTVSRAMHHFSYVLVCEVVPYSGPAHSHTIIITNSKWKKISSILTKCFGVKSLLSLRGMHAVLPVMHIMTWPAQQDAIHNMNHLGWDRTVKW